MRLFVLLICIIFLPSQWVCARPLGNAVSFSLTFSNPQDNSPNGLISISQNNRLKHRQYLNQGKLVCTIDVNGSNSPIVIHYIDKANLYESFTDTLIQFGNEVHKNYIVHKIDYSINRSPNIILILADDLGYGSIEGYGLDTTLARTPVLGKLIKEGLHFTNAYTPSSVCSPTRYGLLTGQYDIRTHKKFGALTVNDPLHIPTSRSTIASVLKSKGYNTAVIGKWHLGYQSKRPVDYTQELSPGPFDIGFDYNWTVPANAGDATGVWVENTHVVGLVDDPSKLSKDEQHPENSYYGGPMLGIPAPFRHDSTIMPVLKNKTLSWLKEQSAEKPFFLYLPTTAIHVPFLPSSHFQEKSKVGKWGDFVLELDSYVGSVINFVDSAGWKENTVIIFTSDNGGSIINEESRIALANGVMVNGNTRGGKVSIFDGGFKVPYIIRWPGTVSSGKDVSKKINLVDTYATIAQLVGGREGINNETAEDSYNFLPYWFNPGNELDIRNNMVLTSGHGHLALILNNYKYIQGIPARPGVNKMRPSLHNLSDDPLEEKNLIFPDSTLKPLFDRILSSFIDTKGTRPYINLNNKPQIVTDTIVLYHRVLNGDTIAQLQAVDIEGDQLDYYLAIDNKTLPFKVDKNGNVTVNNQNQTNNGATYQWEMKILCTDGFDIDTAVVIIRKGLSDFNLLQPDHGYIHYPEEGPHIRFIWQRPSEFHGTEYSLHLSGEFYDSTFMVKDDTEFRLNLLPLNASVNNIYWEVSASLGEVIKKSQQKSLITLIQDPLPAMPIVPTGNISRSDSIYFQWQSEPAYPDILYNVSVFNNEEILYRKDSLDKNIITIAGHRFNDLEEYYWLIESFNDLGVSVSSDTNTFKLYPPIDSFNLISPADEKLLFDGDPVLFEWESAGDRDAINYILHLIINGAAYTFDAGNNTNYTFYRIEYFGDEVDYKWYVTASNSVGLVNSSQVFSFRITLISGIYQKKSIDVSLFPNPSQGILNLTMNEDSVGEIIGLEIFDITGSLVKKVDPKAKRIDITDLNSGVYIFIFKGQQSISIKKVLKI